MALMSASIFLLAGILSSDVIRDQGYIVRLTNSGNDSVLYPCLSDNGQWLLYVLESDNGEQTTRSIQLMNIETKEETRLFQDRKVTAPEPYEDIPLLVGTKPPMLSGDGQVAVIVLSLDSPENILDHFLAIIGTDGTDLRLFSFPIKSLKEKKWEALGFMGDEWERISHYAVNSDGSRVACVMKGHLGPVRYGNASAVILIDTQSGEQKTILSPDFDDEGGWFWPDFPSRPLLGGAWAFSMSGSGDKILFGARSSEDQLDYDLYLFEEEKNRTHRITDFHDRWFSLAELSRDGEKIVFFYTGKKKQGIGTYFLRSEDSEPEYVETGAFPRIELSDLSGNGRYILYKNIYDGVLLDVETIEKRVAFDENTRGYISGLVPMDLPRFPAFWGPHIMSHDGTRILLAGIPEGKKSAEFFLLDLRTIE